MTVVIRFMSIIVEINWYMAFVGIILICSQCLSPDLLLIMLYTVQMISVIVENVHIYIHTYA